MRPILLIMWTTFQSFILRHNNNNNNKRKKEGKIGLSSEKNRKPSLWHVWLATWRKKKSELRKLKRRFDRKKKQEVSRVINQQFNTVPGRVFANLSEMLKSDPENERPRYKDPGIRARDDSRMFENIKEASGFWRKLWEERGTGNKNAAWLPEVKIAIHEQVPPPTGDEWALEVAEAVKVLSKKHNWIAPGPDKITNVCWKRASTPHKGVVKSLKEVSMSNEDNPEWFSEGRTSLSERRRIPE